MCGRMCQQLLIIICSVADARAWRRSLWSISRCSPIGRLLVRRFELPQRISQLRIERGLTVYFVIWSDQRLHVPFYDIDLVYSGKESYFGKMSIRRKSNGIKLNQNLPASLKTSWTFDLVFWRFTWAIMGWMRCDLLSMVSSRIESSCSVCIRIDGWEEARLADIPWRISVKFCSFKCCRASFIRKSLKLAIALLWTLALLSCMILHLISTIWINFDAGDCLIKARFFVIQESS